MSTHPLMLPSNFPRMALLACPSSPPWSLPPLLWSSPFPLHAPTLIPFSLADLCSLPLHDLVIWTNCSISFSFAKSGFDVLANCSLCDNAATLSFSAGLVCLSFSAEACAILQALSWSRQHQQVRLFSSYLRLSLCPLLRLSFYLKLSGSLQWVPGQPFLPENNAGNELAKRKALFLVSVIPCSLSPIHSYIFSDWKRTSHLNSSTHRFPRFARRISRLLITIAVSSLVFAAMNTALRSALTSLESAKSRILNAAPVVINPNTRLLSFCTVKLRTLRRSLFGDFLSLYEF